MKEEADASGADRTMKEEADASGADRAMKEEADISGAGRASEYQGAGVKCRIGKKRMARR